MSPEIDSGGRVGFFPGSSRANGRAIGLAEEAGVRHLD